MELGRLEKIELRELWKGEASDFTPWLSLEENIALLGNTIGVELEIVDQEKSVGMYRADILCKDTLADRYVLIENQLERTDHGHLGQLLTYAAGLDAVTIIWIAKTFSEEHRAAIDWLNNISDEKFNFFGIEIEVYKIGESVPAPFFQIIAKPNDWSKSLRKGTVSNVKITETKQLQLEYWGAMKNYFESSGTNLKTQKPKPQHWTNFAIGKSNFYLSATVSMRDSFIRIELIIDGNEAKENYFKIKNQYESELIEYFDDEVEWNELPDAKLSSIHIKKDANTNRRSEWSEQHEWFRINIEKFDDFFRQKLKLI